VASEKSKAGLIDSAENKPPWETVVQKLLVPTIRRMIEDRSYNIFSNMETRGLTSLIGTLASTTEEPILSAILSLVLTLLTKEINEISIPMLNLDAYVNLRNESLRDEEIDSVGFLVFGQIQRLQKLILNVMNHWIPLFESERKEREMQQLVLTNLVGNMFLPVLDTLRRFEDSRETPKPTYKRMFHPVWNGLKKLGWLENADTMLLAGPVRAAAHAYDIDRDHDSNEINE